MTSWLEVQFAGETLVLDAGLGLWWPERRLLAVSDLHLEKSTWLARFGAHVAPYDTADTLARLAGLVEKYRPETLLLLGDSFHDAGAPSRLDPLARLRLADICASVKECRFIEGNHDAGITVPGGMVAAVESRLGNIVFRHEPADCDLPQIVGHFHPRMKMRLRGHSLSGKCFAINDRMLVMPAFGSFTGGLDLGHDVLVALAGEQPFRPCMVYRNTITRVKTE